MRHTYKLVKAIMCMKEKNRNRQVLSFRERLPCVPFSLLFRLDNLRYNVSLHLKYKLIMKRIIAPNSAYHQNK